MDMRQNGTNEDKIEIAKRFASEKFEEVVKKNHFLDVFQILHDEFNIEDQNVLIAGILHDTLEDTSATYEEITNIFSSKR
jgi:(p)ppGpp synthase/HD superfamily hydrolase